jgi:hypothetical protein
MAAVRISMPADLADTLVDDRIARRPFTTRGPGTDVLIRMVIDDVNTGASVVTLVVAADAVRKFAGRLWARLRQSQEDIVTVTVTAPDMPEPRELRVRRDDRAGEDKILDFLIEVLPASHD